MCTLNDFQEIVFVDFEYRAAAGARPSPVCMVAKELRSGRVFKLFGEDLTARSEPPFATGEDTLFVAYYASAELGCHLVLRWPLAEYVLDLYAEFRNCTNGYKLPAGRSLLGALAFFGLDSIAAAEKEGMRELIIGHDVYTPEQIGQILSYCESDVDALMSLFHAMAPRLGNLGRALLRGRYMKAVARMEHVGIPIDTAAYVRISERWEHIEQAVIDEVNRYCPVYEGAVFKYCRFENWIDGLDLVWPRLDTGKYALDDETFETMSVAHPEVRPLRSARRILAQLRLSRLEIGPDGRNRCMLSPFGSRTGRNQPSNAKFVFGFPSWMRGLIQPEPGKGLAYIDFEQQEFGIAAALSGDTAMRQAYLSGDPYLAFARLAGAVPEHATKHSHPLERDQFKIVSLAILYQMGPQGLAHRLNASPHWAQELLRAHRDIFRRYWQWLEGALDFAHLEGYLPTVFDWRLYLTADTTDRTLGNYPMQANGAEILRLACSLLAERGIAVCAPVHDAVLIEAPADQLDATVSETQSLLEQAASIVLQGFPLRTEKKLIRHPERLIEERGRLMWEQIQKWAA
jgi:hypothetical protein